MVRPKNKNTSPGVHEIYNFGRPFLGHHTCIRISSYLCLRVEKKVLKEIHEFEIRNYVCLVWGFM